jgi:hypothetical protein
VSSVPAQTLSIGTTNTLGSFTLDRQPTTSQNLSVRTSWTNLFFRTVTVCVYMSGPMTGTGANLSTITASSVRVNGTSIVTGSTNCGVPSATKVGSQNVILGFSGSRTDTLTIDLNSFSAALPPDTYTGTINLVATTQ